MFNAEAARAAAARANDIDGDVAQEETQMCLRVIQKAAESGLRTCYITVPNLHGRLVKARLEKLGFTITTTADQRDGDYTTASW